MCLNFCTVGFVDVDTAVELLRKNACMKCTVKTQVLGASLLQLLHVHNSNALIPHSSLALCLCVVTPVYEVQMPVVQLCGPADLQQPMLTSHHTSGFAILAANDNQLARRGNCLSAATMRPLHRVPHPCQVSATISSTHAAVQDLFIFASFGVPFVHMNT